MLNTTFPDFLISFVLEFLERKMGCTRLRVNNRTKKITLKFRDTIRKKRDDIRENIYKHALLELKSTKYYSKRSGHRRAIIVHFT